MSIRIHAWIVSAVIVLMGAGCTQLPTEKAEVSDMRPQISFKADKETSQRARVFVDGLEVGFVGDYLNGKNSLLVLPGNHVLQVRDSTGVLLEERFYLGEGATKSFTVR